MRITVLEAAKDEMRESREYYEAQRVGLGEDFLRAVEDAIRRIEAFPNAWSRLSNKVRRCRTNRFPHGVVYALRGNEIVVLAVMHLKRRPGYWRDRLKHLPPM